MIWLVIFGVTAVLLIIAKLMYENTCLEIVPTILLSVAILSLLIGVACGLCSITSYMDRDGVIAAYQVKYDTLVYQLNDGAYDNTIDYNRKELFDDIMEYNSDVTRGRIYHKDMWLHVFYPENWDNLPLIELENYDSSN